MPLRRTTFSKFIIEDERRREDPDPELTGLLNDIQTACKFIASAVSRGVLGSDAAPGNSIAATAREIMLRECEWGGKLCGMVAGGMEAPYRIPDSFPRGRYLLAFHPLVGSSNVDVNVTVGTIFSVLRAPAGVTTAEAADFLQPGVDQIAAGFALFGPASMIVITLGAGVHGFTLDREIGAYTLTHPDMRIPEDSREFAIDASNERFWEPPVRHYVEECVAGVAGARGVDFHMRWIDSLVAEVYRILVRGGLFIFPRSEKQPGSGGLRLLYEASPMAMIVEQAGGAATTGRARILELLPTELHAAVPVALGSRLEVERLARYHRTHDSGEELSFDTPLFQTRSLFRSV